MKKINLILLGILVFQLIIFAFKPFSHKFFYDSRTDLYKNIQTSDITSIVIINHKDNKKITIRKKEKNWLVTDAFDFKADKTKIDEILLNLKKLGNVKEVASNPEIFPSYKLGKNNKPREIQLLDSKNNVLIDVLIGKSMVGGSFIKIKGKEVIYKVNASFDAMISSDTKEYLAKTSITMPVGKDRKEVILKFKGNTINFKKIADSKMQVVEGKPKTVAEQWKVEISNPNLPENWADATKIQTFVDSLDGVYIDGIAGKYNKTADSEFGFDNPYLELTIKTDKKSLTLVVGNKLEKEKDKKDASRYLLLKDETKDNDIFEGYVLSINSYNYDNWAKTFDDLKKKDLKINQNKEVSDEELGGKIQNMKIPAPKLKLNVKSTSNNKPLIINKPVK